MLKPSGPTLFLFRVWRWGPVRFTAPGCLGTTSAYDTWRRLTPPHYKVPTAVANNNWVALENFRSNIGTRKLPICRSTRVLWGLLGVSDIWFCIVSCEVLGDFPNMDTTGSRSTSLMPTTAYSISFVLSGLRTIESQWTLHPLNCGVSQLQASP